MLLWVHQNCNVAVFEKSLKKLYFAKYATYGKTEFALTSKKGLYKWAHDGHIKLFPQLKKWLHSLRLLQKNLS